MAKSVLHSDKARRALEKGIDILSKAVGVTLGASGEETSPSEVGMARPKLLTTG